MCMSFASVMPLTLMTAHASGTTSGTRMPIVPQLVPVANAVIAASVNTATGTQAAGIDSPSIEIR